MRSRALISLLPIWWCLASGCWQGVTRDAAATVISAHGAVVFKMEGQRDFRPVTPESQLAAGSTIRALDNAQLNLALLPNALLRLSSNSEVTIKQLKITKDGNETGDAMRNRVARIRVNRGKIIFLFTRRGKSPSQFAINAAPVTITADADCLVCVGSDGARARVTCVRGETHVSYDTQPPAAVGAGYFQQWPSSRAASIAATDDAAAQIDVADSLEFENELHAIQFDLQKRRPF